MRARLEVLRGAKTKRLTLRLPTVVGRGGEANIKLPASTVSRHHCEIYVYEGQIVVRDLASSNGTIVNGHKILGPTFLTVDDELSIGPVTVRLVAITDENQPDTPKRDAADLEDVLPDLAQLPNTRCELPVSASAIDAGSAGPGLGPEDSVLRYVEQGDTGRSFVDISESRAAPLDADLPTIDSEQTVDPNVPPDDRALHDFLKKLDG